MDYTANALAKAAGCSPRTIATDIKSGKIKAEKATGQGGWRGVRYVISKEVAEEYIKYRETIYTNRKKYRAGDGENDQPPRFPDCSGYSACLDKAARGRGRIACQKCGQYNANQDYLRCEVV